nr:MAG TPA: hypothetical protein [Caudoviricetes sp.]
MDFITFPVAATNIFPCANTTNGGQLVTEFNLRSRESISTSQSVSYMIGPSYVHSERDFYVSIGSSSSDIFSDESDLSNPATIRISEGSGVINGHFVQTLVPMIVDIAPYASQLSGHLSIGFRIMYSTEMTMAGAILAENQDNYYEGVQVVILPTSDFKLPEDVPDDQSLVTAHILLATFDYYNGSITNMKQNYPNKCVILDADRIANVDKLLTDDYLHKSGLNYKKFYTFAGKGKDPKTQLDTWCDTTDALMIWDTKPEPLTPTEFIENAKDQGLSIQTNVSAYTSMRNLLARYPEALFDSLPTDEVALVVPHKELDYPIHTSNGTQQMYPIKVYKLPVADFISNTSGTVDRAYTMHVKDITQKINDLYHLTSGKQRCYIPILNSRDDLPDVNQQWNTGDYILVGQDNTIDITDTDYTQAPASIYVVIPGIVKAIKYRGCGENLTSETVNLPSGGGTLPPDGVLIQSIKQSEVPDIQDPAIYNPYFHLTENEYRGTINTDYFAIDVPVIDSSTQEQKLDPISKLPLFDRYFYTVSDSGKKTYTDPPIWLTDEIPLAQTDRIGGFLNVEDTATDAGYIIRDDEGHLRLIDYALLRSGTLAYQLGEDFETSSGLSISEIQAQLDEYVNERVAFPNSRQMNKAITNSDTYIPDEINIIIHLSAATEDEISAKSTTLTIHSIDSRFNTHINLKIQGTADSNTIINIVDCEKVRIDSISGTPTVNIYRSCLYYDYNILNYLALGTISDLRLWYAKRLETDPELLVDYMTVREFDTPINATSTDFYADSIPNDNHFLYGLQSLTFSSDGTIVGCSILVRNDSTSNIKEGKFIIGGDFSIPQGGSLMYPTKLLRKQLKITGQFVSAYHLTTPDTWMVQNTSFTALSQVDNYSATGQHNTISGSITFLVDAFYVDNAQILIGTGSSSVDSIDGWDPSKYHIFYGGTLS